MKYASLDFFKKRTSYKKATVSALMLLFFSITLGWKFSKLKLKFSNSGWRVVYSQIFYFIKVEKGRKCVTHFSQICSPSEFSCLLTQPGLVYEVSTKLS